jgi:hypothetical protein
MNLCQRVYYRHASALPVAFNIEFSFRLRIRFDLVLRQFNCSCTLVRTVM